MSDEAVTAPGSESELLRIIGAAAYDIHISRSEELTCNLPTMGQWQAAQKGTVDYLIDGCTVRFASIEARNRIVAAYKYADNREEFSHDLQRWLSVAHDLWRHEIGKSDSAAGRLLALVHETYDIFSIAADAIKIESMRVFVVLHVVESALPYLKELPPNGVLNLSAVQHERTKNVLAAGMFFGKLEKTLVEQPHTCRTIHDRLRNSITEATANLHPTALVALAKSSPRDAVRLALEDAESSNSMLKSIALRTLGRLLTLTLIAADSISSAITAILAGLSDPEEQVRHTAIRAAAGVVPVMDAFDNSLALLGEAGDQFALGAIADSLFMNFSDMRSKANFNDWIRLVSKASPSSRGTLGNFDYVLAQLIADDAQQQFAISCFTDWVGANAKDMARDKSVAELFPTVTIELANRPELFSQVITDWMLSDNRRPASAAAGLLSHLWAHEFKHPEFSTQRLDALEQSDLLFLARRMLGFIYSEDHLLSLTMSFLKTKDAPHRVFGLVRALCVDELGKDYPSSTITMLETACAAETKEEWQRFYTTTVEEIKSRINALDALPRLVELRPSPELQRQFAKARAKQMSAAVEEAQKGSIVRQIATEVPIKAGIGWFSFRNGGYTDATHMRSFSQSVSVPMREAFDAVGYEISHLWLRKIKRGES
ncbi:MAG: hypothetical protein WD823_13585 [Sulfuricaulis sp.]|uniref:hypothetical protein n=1 Tax=Sulfuricaulis sp. TaxID=2003553 RepID=UPI0034A58B5F